MKISIINYLNMEQEITTLKRHLLSATRVFIAAFIGSITFTLSTTPISISEEFLRSLFISAIIAGTSAVLKMVQEYLSPKNK